MRMRGGEGAPVVGVSWSRWVRGWLDSAPRIGFLWSSGAALSQLEPGPNGERTEAARAGSSGRGRRRPFPVRPVPA